MQTLGYFLINRRYFYRTSYINTAWLYKIRQCVCNVRIILMFVILNIIKDSSKLVICYDL